MMKEPTAVPESVADEIQTALREAGVALRARPAPDVAPAVRERLEQRTTPAPRRANRWRGVLAASVAAVALALVPGVRGAVADLIDSIPGISFDFDRGGSSVTPTPPVLEPGRALGAPLGLIGATDLATARDQVPYEIPVPAGLGEPGAVYVREGVVTMLWPASSSLPALAGTNVGLVIDVIDGSHGPVFEKLLRDVEVEWLAIDGAPAAWVGEAHPLVVVNAEGVPDREFARIAARTLLVSGTTTVRVESMLSRDAAVALVQSFDGSG